jgi:hypothetical protein
MWNVLRDKRFTALRFRRQQPIGPYIVDFYCSAAKLVIELDGNLHGRPEQKVAMMREHDGLNSRGGVSSGFGTATSCGISRRRAGTSLRKSSGPDYPTPKFAPRTSTLPQGEGEKSPCRYGRLRVPYPFF